MKKIKIVAVLTAALVLFGVYFSTAFALSDGLNALGEYFGLSGNENGNAEAEENEDPDANDDVSTTWGLPQANADSGISGVLQGILGNAANALTNSQLTEILNRFDVNSLLGGDSDMLNELMDLIGANTPTKASDDNGSQSQTPSQTYTVPSYTSVYVTEAPAVTYNYTPGTTAYDGIVTTTNPAETTTLYYVAPSTVYAEQITTLPYDYQVEPTEISEKDGVTLKTIIGIAILLISGVAVVGVALSLKKSKV